MTNINFHFLVPRVSAYRALSCYPLSGLQSSRARWPVVPNFCSQMTRNLSFFIQVICWAPQILQVQSMGPFQFFLEHSLTLYCQYKSVFRVFIRQQRSENFPLTMQNSLANNSIAYDYFLFRCEAPFKYSPVLFCLPPATWILSENPECYYYICHKTTGIVF